MDLERTLGHQQREPWQQITSPLFTSGFVANYTCLHCPEPQAPALHGQLPAAPARPDSRGHGPLLPTLYILQKC